MVSRSHMRTYAYKQNHFGSWVLWDWVPSINSTCFSFNIIVSERDTPIQKYRVGTWHSDPRIPYRNVTLRSKNTVSERDTSIQKYRVGTWRSGPRIPCWNVTPDPLLLHVRTWYPIPYYYVSERDTWSPITTCMNVTLRSISTFNLSFVVTDFNSLLY